MILAQETVTFSLTQKIREKETCDVVSGQWREGGPVSVRANVGGLENKD